MYDFLDSSSVNSFSAKIKINLLSNPSPDIDGNVFEQPLDYQFEFNVTLFNVTTWEYSCNAGSSIMLNDKETEASLNAEWSYRIALNRRDDNTFTVKKIYLDNALENDYGLKIYQSLIIFISYLYYQQLQLIFRH